MTWVSQRWLFLINSNKWRFTLAFFRPQAHELEHMYWEGCVSVSLSSITFQDQTSSTITQLIMPSCHQAILPTGISLFLLNFYRLVLGRKVNTIKSNIIRSHEESIFMLKHAEWSLNDLLNHYENFQNSLGILSEAGKAKGSKMNPPKVELPERATSTLLFFGPFHSWLLSILIAVLSRPQQEQLD